jgi:phosphoribosylformylglycinamidine (FGAM) synthase PurS component
LVEKLDCSLEFELEIEASEAGKNKIEEIEAAWLSNASISSDEIFI